MYPTVFWMGHARWRTGASTYSPGSYSELQKKKRLLAAGSLNKLVTHALI